MYNIHSNLLYLDGDKMDVDTMPPDPWYRPDRVDPAPVYPPYSRPDLFPGVEDSGVVSQSGGFDNMDNIDNKGVDLPENFDSNANANVGSQKKSENKDIDVWTIYIIVGSVAGGVLLVGVVAIIVALCCNRYEDEGYKHTNV